jgi:hypothetical protein
LGLLVSETPAKPFKWQEDGPLFVRISSM